MPYKDPEIRRIKARKYSKNYREKHYERYRDNENKRSRERWETDEEYKQRRLKQHTTHRLLHKEEHNANSRRDYKKHKEKRIKHKVDYHRVRYQTDEVYREKTLKRNKLNWERNGEKYTENHKPYLKEYYQTEHGKLMRKKHYTIRKRKLGFNPIIPNILDEKIVWHHIDDDNVVPIPRDLHLLYYGGHDTEKHRENLKPIIEQLYETKF